MNARAQATAVIQPVIFQERSLSSTLPPVLTKTKEPALVQALCYGTLRYYYRLKPIANKLLLSPLKTKHNDVFCLLLIGLYQLIYMDIAEYAAVSETVAATKTLKKTWAKALINKTLRRFICEKESLLTFADRSLPSQYAHPKWFINAIKKDWPEQWSSILTANNAQPPMTLRINRQKISRDEYVALLTKNNIAATALPSSNAAVLLKTPLAVTKLTGFKEGLVYVQDTAGQHTPTLLDLKSGQRVLDACAAPGSKTSHILEAEPNLKQLVSVDNNAERLEKIKDNIDRLQLPNDRLTLKLGNAEKTKEWWDGEPFDRILLDAPCSATGVIRRHPDIKLLRKENDIYQHTAQQYQLLTALWPLLAEGGKLLYSTCSVLKAENETVIQKFLNAHTDAEATPINIPESINTAVGCQLLPIINGPDGFYYALLNKTKSSPLSPTKQHPARSK